MGGHGRPGAGGALPAGRGDHRPGAGGTYHGSFQVKLGPTTASYRGTIRIADADEAAHRAMLAAKGTDARGRGGATATIVNTLSETGTATRVTAVTDLAITGRLASFGRGGMIEDVSNRLLRDFATCLQSRLTTPAAPSGAEVASGEAPPEAVAAAAPGETMDAEDAAASAGATLPPPRPERR